MEHIITAPRRLVVIGWALCVVLILFIAGTAARDAFLSPPRRDRAAEAVRGIGELLAYEVWDGVPHAVVRERHGPRDASRVIFDRMRVDVISIEWPPTPAWQLTGAWYYIAATDAPASLGVARCTGTLARGATRRRNCSVRSTRRRSSPWRC